MLELNCSHIQLKTQRHGKNETSKQGKTENGHRTKKGKKKRCDQMSAALVAIVCCTDGGMNRRESVGQKQTRVLSQDDTKPFFFQASSNVIGSRRFTVPIMSDPFRTKTS